MPPAIVVKPAAAAANDGAGLGLIHWSKVDFAKFDPSKRKEMTRIKKISGANLVRNAIQMRTNVPHTFAIGDIVGQPMLAHEAVHEAHLAAEVIAGELQGNKELAAAAFNARVIPSLAYTDPEVAWVGLTEDQAKAQGIKLKKGLFH